MMVLYSVSETAACGVCVCGSLLACSGLVTMLPVDPGLVVARIRSVVDCVRDINTGPTVCGVVVDYPPDPS